VTPAVMVLRRPRIFAVPKMCSGEEIWWRGVFWYFKIMGIYCL
jgi:hypothetical protein